jgi:hypothetical protein
VDATGVSDRMFGRGCRLPLAVWVLQHPKGRFFQSEPPAFGTTTPSNIRQELARLVQLGMLEEERPDDVNKVFYVRTDHALWRIIEVAAEVLELRWQDDRLTGL